MGLGIMATLFLIADKNKINNNIVLNEDNIKKLNKNDI